MASAFVDATATMCARSMRLRAGDSPGSGGRAEEQQNSEGKRFGVGTPRPIRDLIQRMPDGRHALFPLEQPSSGPGGDRIRSLVRVPRIRPRLLRLAPRRVRKRTDAFSATSYASVPSLKLCK